MVSLPLFDEKGKSSGTLAADDKVFGVKPKKSVIHSVLVWQLAGMRQGTASTKTRGEVRGGGKKPWKQKGTGRARAGSIRSPLWNGGGVVFGPKPRDYSYRLPKKVRELAIRMLLAEKAASGSIKVIEKLSVPGAKTKEMASLMKNAGITSALMALDGAGPAEKRAAANIKKIKLVSSNNLTVFDILKYGTLVLDRDAVAALEGRFKK